ncbi:MULTISPECIES: hypothetical protein [unclassified Pseudoclavibacter]|jgi:hypothetical protein|uniref:hypothetical protein n=1 Tax=unclassified Pseudoclavibacter TaxID=2615177 RepID=UPI000CE7CA43|nr:MULTISPECIES: hypothetical protein [unclassified Pseudoclavibacter]MBS3177859.1 SPOR domain-containing protein [Pseudoclavibacter sp. Marseille-Q4354]PPG29462.1 hypothetical protein C5B97_10745 [Pseudoclavibacter sp. RFBB5]
MTDTHAQEFWYNSRTGEVEVGKQSLGSELVGPFTSEAEARRAPEKLQERAKAWAEEEADEDR